jgi:hypothetical protein
MVWDDPERALDLAAEVLWEAWDRAAQRAQRCGCHACRQSLAELRAWLSGREQATMSAYVCDSLGVELL